MGIRTVLRIGMVALAGVVGVMVWARWEPEPAASSGAEARPVPEIPQAERDVRSSTTGLNVVQSADGRKTLQVSADRQMDFEDGWKVWENPSIVIHGRRQDTDDDSGDVRITGETMRTTGAVGDFSEVRIIGQVAAELPGGGTFQTRRIDYDAVTGIASNCNRNALTYSGLRVGSDCLELDTSGDAGGGSEVVPEQLRMWGELDLAADAASGGRLPPGLGGGGSELRFRPGGERVTIEGAAFLEFADVSVDAELLELTVGGDLRELEAVRASGGPSLRLGRGRESRRLAGREIEIELLEAAVESVRASGGPARLNLPDVGGLRAPEIVLRVGDGTTEVTATGGAEWSGDEAGEAGLRTLTATELTLTSEQGRLSALEAGGGVRLQGGDELEGTFSGPTLVMGWTEGRLTAARWPDGAEIESGDRHLAAGRASRQPTGWVLDGEPRPTVRAEGIQLTADRLQLSDEGSMQASGAVAGRLGGERLSAGAALFGDAAEVEFRSTVALLGAEGQTRLRGDVSVIWGSQSLVTEELVLERSPGRVRALREVELVASLEREGGEATPVTVTADHLLVEEDSGDIRVAGEARLRDAERTISAERMAILLDDSGGWRRIEAEGEVEFREPDVTAEGGRLEYDLDTQELLLLAGEDEPARFVYEDLEYRSSEALRVSRQGDDLVIEATEAGRTTTKVVSTDGETDGDG